MIKNIVPIITCVNMSDFLSTSLKYNRSFFEEYYILTSTDDVETKKVCQKYDAKFIEYPYFFCENSKFNKSGGLFFAQKFVHRYYEDNWVLLMDADIVLKRDFVEVIQNLGLKQPIFRSKETKFIKLPSGHIIEKKPPHFDPEPSVMYSIYRYDISSNKELFKEPSENKYPEILNHAGYFQLYFDKSKYYASFSVDASQCDMDFKEMFPNRIMIDSYIFHLGRKELHWEGRSCGLWE